jgi:hypothetical protein
VYTIPETISYRDALRTGKHGRLTMYRSASVVCHGRRLPHHMWPPMLPLLRRQRPFLR